MDKRKLRLILLGIAGIIILVIGIAAANIYFGTDREVAELQDTFALVFHGKSSWNELTDSQKAEFWELRPDLLRPDLGRRNAQFTKWIVTWVVMPLGLFAILTAAIIASRVIYNRFRPPSGSS